MNENFKESILGEKTLSQKELELVQKLAAITKKRNLYGTEEQLFTKLRGKE